MPLDSGLPLAVARKRDGEVMPVRAFVEESLQAIDGVAVSTRMYGACRARARVFANTFYVRLFVYAS